MGKLLDIMRYFALSLVVLCLSCSSGERQQWMQDEGKIKILSTTAIVDDMVGNIGGEYIDRLVLIQGALNPHSYELVKGDDEKLGCADLIFYSGLGLEHGPSLAAYLEGNGKAFSIGEMIVKEHPDKVLIVDGQIDPHIWMDVSLWSSGAKGIVDHLSRIDPEHAQEYRKRGEAYLKKLQDLDQKLRDEMLLVEEHRRYLITSHDAFNYFSRRYLATDEEVCNGCWQARCTAPEGLAPDGQLSTTDIQNVIDHLVTYQVSVLFPESNLSRDSIQKIHHAGRKKGLDVQIAKSPLFGDTMGKGDTYEQMMQHNIYVIKEHLIERP